MNVGIEKGMYSCPGHLPLPWATTSALGLLAHLAPWAWAEICPHWCEVPQPAALCACVQLWLRLFLL